MNNQVGDTETTIYVGGLLEKVALNTTTDWRHSIVANGKSVALVSRTSAGTNTTRYILDDYQGSISKITDNSGAIAVSESFTAFGARRNAATWSGSPTSVDLNTINNITRDGYTGHTALGNMGLNHMNGRVQDALTGRFLSADPYVSDAGNTQSFNRYSYVNNRPLYFIDPSGYAICQIGGDSSLPEYSNCSESENGTAAVLVGFSIAAGGWVINQTGNGLDRAGRVIRSIGDNVGKVLGFGGGGHAPPPRAEAIPSTDTALGELHPFFANGAFQVAGNRFGSGEPGVDARAEMLMRASPEVRRQVAIGAGLATVGMAGGLAVELAVGGTAASTGLGTLVFEGSGGALGGQGTLVGRQLVLENFSVLSETPSGLLGPARQLLQYAQAQGATSIRVVGTITSNQLRATLGVTSFDTTFAATRAGILEALGRLP